MTTDTNNVSANAIPVTTSEGTFNVQPELLREYTKEAFRLFEQISIAKEELKGVLEAAAEGTKVPKKIIRKYLKSKYDAKVDEAVETGNVFEQLNLVMEA